MAERGETGDDGGEMEKGTSPWCRRTVAATPHRPAAYAAPRPPPSAPNAASQSSKQRPRGCRSVAVAAVILVSSARQASQPRRYD